MWIMQRKCGGCGKVFFHSRISQRTLDFVYVNDALKLADEIATLQLSPAIAPPFGGF